MSRRTCRGRCPSKASVPAGRASSCRMPHSSPPRGQVPDPVLLLALDTATPAVTVALHDGSAVLAEVGDRDARRHAELLAPAIERALSAAGATPADLTDVAGGTRPGPLPRPRGGLGAARGGPAPPGPPRPGGGTVDGAAPPGPGRAPRA